MTKCASLGAPPPPTLHVRSAGKALSHGPFCARSYTVTVRGLRTVDGGATCTFRRRLRVVKHVGARIHAAIVEDAAQSAARGLRVETDISRDGELLLALHSDGRVVDEDACVVTLTLLHASDAPLTVS